MEQRQVRSVLAWQKAVKRWQELLKLFRKGISRRAARLTEDGEGGDAEGVDSMRRYLLLLNKR